jgi:hypothetical protein
MEPLGLVRTGNEPSNPNIASAAAIIPSESPQ